MQALHQLVHSLAKEEKRLYNLHGRKARFARIYEGYLGSATYEKGLDRQIYAEHFSSFSKAFYSMQKNALLDDILAVLLEYSNSSRADFSLTKLKSKYEVLVHKGFHDLALQYVKTAKDISKKSENQNQQLRILEDYRDILSQTENVTWDEYALSIEEIEELHKLGYTRRLIDEEIRKLNVLINGVGQADENRIRYKTLSSNILNNIKAIAQNEPGQELLDDVYSCELRFSKAFDDAHDHHRRLIGMEKKYASSEYPRKLHLTTINQLMESSMNVGDFLLINGLIYKTSKIIPNLTETEKSDFLARFLELSAVYHYYENDLPLSQRELSDLMALSNISPDDEAKYFHQKISILIAANLPRSAKMALDEFSAKYNNEQEEIPIRLYEIIISVEMNNRDEATEGIHKMNAALRKVKNPRKYAPLRNFLEQLERHIERKTHSFQEISGLESSWQELLKIDLWLKAKIENSFYYNYVLGYWQMKKQILKVS